MDRRMEVKQDQKKIYDIVFADSKEKLPQEFAALGYQDRRICIVTDSNVGPLYGEETAALLRPFCKSVELFVFEAGEAQKTLDTVRRLYAFLIEHHFDRKDCLVALGGGVVGDLTGYAAATYLRGIDYIQLPTSLLAMVDSSVGGKTGVDFDAYKNMVGAFKMPRLVYMDLSCLKTLPDVQYYNGMAEVIKYGLICDLDFYMYLLSHFSEITDRDEEAAGHIVAESCNQKRIIVEEDPTEKGVRALLNFGHTAGHAIEKLMDFSLLHGQCVALGMVCASYISWKRGMISKEEFLEIRDVLVALSLPVTLTMEEGSAKVDFAEKIVQMTKSDKKMDGGKIRFILLRSVGEGYIDEEVTDQELRDALLNTLLAPQDQENLSGDQIVSMSDILNAAGADTEKEEDVHESQS